MALFMMKTSLRGVEEIVFRICYFPWGEIWASHTGGFRRLNKYKPSEGTVCLPIRMKFTFSRGFRNLQGINMRSNSHLLGG